MAFVDRWEADHFFQRILTAKRTGKGDLKAVVRDFQNRLQGSDPRVVREFNSRVGLLIGPLLEEEMRKETSPAPPPVGREVDPVPEVQEPNLIDPERDIRLIEDEAARQEAQRRSSLQEILGVREQRISELRDILLGEEARQLTEAVPGILEQTNARGLLRSSGLGQELSRASERLAGQTNLQLALAGLSDRDLESQFLGDITNRRIGLQTGGLERRFTLEDFQREADLAKELGSSITPQVGGSDENRFSLARTITGAGGGAGVGFAIGGPPGAAIGAGLGLLSSIGGGGK